MTVFTKNRLKNFGALRDSNGRNLLEGCGIVESRYMGRLESDGEVVVGFVTNFSEVYFVSLGRNSWHIIRSIKSLSSIFSLHPLTVTQSSP